MLRARELERGIVQNELVLFFQPQVDLRSGALAGVEALVRWRHPTRGLLPPDSFIPLAESSRLIEDLTEWVLAAALKQWGAWRARRFNSRIAVNLPANCLGDITLPDRIAALCRSYGAPVSALAMELTESAVAQDPVAAADVLTRLRIKGAELSLDDFGTGYSSLLQLQQLPFSELKIDKSFVVNAVARRDDRVIAKAIIDLAHNLGLQALAEGIESEPVLRLLTELGCDRGQGYYFARPMAGEAIPVWAASREPEDAKRRVGSD